jgi:hypothetical protein
LAARFLLSYIGSDGRFIAAVATLVLPEQTADQRHQFTSRCWRAVFCFRLPGIVARAADQECVTDGCQRKWSSPGLRVPREQRRRPNAVIDVRAVGPPWPTDLSLTAIQNVRALAIPTGGMRNDHSEAFGRLLRSEHTLSLLADSKHRVRCTRFGPLRSFQSFPCRAKDRFNDLRIAMTSR